MNPFAAVAVKTLSAASAAALLSMGAAGVIAQAASPTNPNAPTATAGTKHSNDAHADRRLIAKGVFAAEATTLGMSEVDLRAALKGGAKVSELAGKKGMDKAAFAKALAPNVKKNLDALVGKGITQVQEDKVLDRIAKGHIPFWNGVHHKKK
jgi:hypothetical protein